MYDDVYVLACVYACVCGIFFSVHETLRLTKIMPSQANGYRILKSSSRKFISAADFDNLPISYSRNIIEL